MSHTSSHYLEYIDEQETTETRPSVDGIESLNDNVFRPKYEIVSYE